MLAVINFILGVVLGLGMFQLGRLFERRIALEAMEELSMEIMTACAVAMKLQKESYEGKVKPSQKKATKAPAKKKAGRPKKVEV
jgi:hypothetical protein